MKAIRFIFVGIGWFIIGISVMFYAAACGIGWAGEHLIRAGIGGVDG